LEWSRGGVLHGLCPMMGRGQVGSSLVRCGEGAVGGSPGVFAGGGHAGGELCGYGSPNWVVGSGAGERTDGEGVEGSGGDDGVVGCEGF